MPCGWKLTVGLASHWPCHALQISVVYPPTGSYGIQGREMSTPPTLLTGYGTLYLYPDSRQSGTGRPMQSKILPKISITDVKDALYHFEVSASFGVDDPECTEHPRNSEQHEHRQCARQTRPVTSLAACCLYTSRQHCKLHALCTLQCRRYQHFNYTARQKKGTTFLLRINLLIHNVIWQNLVLIIVNEYYN